MPQLDRSTLTVSKSFTAAAPPDGPKNYGPGCADPCPACGGSMSGEPPRMRRCVKHHKPNYGKGVRDHV
jgi:hypothetical protein